MMPVQRVRVAESRARNKSSNGPLRAQSKENFFRVFCDVGHASVVGSMKVLRQVRESNREAGWHREFIFLLKYIRP